MDILSMNGHQSYQGRLQEREYALDGYTGIYGGPDMGGSNLRIGTKLCDWIWGFIKIDLHRYLPNWFNNTRFVYI